MNIGSVIYSILSNDASTSGLVSTRIVPDMLPIDTDFPAIMYSVYDMAQTEHKDGTTDWDEFSVDLNLFSTSKTELETLSGYVRTALSRYSGTVATKTVITAIFNGFDDSVSKIGESTVTPGQAVYIRTMDFTIVMK